ncbi:hypothetical protein B7Z17_04085, partial [Candidatus Saccharibacteria bacterium 32-49-10]
TYSLWDGTANVGIVCTSNDGGATWTEKSSGDSRNWYGVASSGDGKKLAAIANNGYIYTSSDAGETWTARTSAGLRYWRYITSSNDGTRLIAVHGEGYIYTSSDSGVTWNQQATAGIHEWRAVAGSGDLSKIAVVAHSGYAGSIYLANREPPVIDTFNLTTLSGAAQSATSPAITGAQISITSETCYTLDESSIATLGGVASATPEANVDILGGVAFDISCVTPGGSSVVDIALDAQYADDGTLRAYKGVGSGVNTVLTDITNQVSFVNKQVSGTTKTVLSYQLADGGDFDEDSTANGTIVDPIYIGLVNDASLAATGTNIWLLVLAATALVGGSSFTLHKLTRKR